MINSYNPFYGQQSPYNTPNNFNNSYYNPIPQPPYQAPLQQPPASNQNNNISFLNGKIVDSEDIVRVTEVPIGSYGIFPKADFSEIYIKFWKQDGTTDILHFKPDKPIVPVNTASEINNAEELNKILKRIDDVEQKIDAMMSQERIVTAAPQTPEVKQIRKKEVNLNEY